MSSVNFKFDKVPALLPTPWFQSVSTELFNFLYRYTMFPQFRRLSAKWPMPVWKEGDALASQNTCNGFGSQESADLVSARYILYMPPNGMYRRKQLDLVE